MIAKAQFAIPNDLVSARNLVGGEWASAISKETFPIRSPITGETLAEVPSCSLADVDKAVAAAKSAFPKYRSMPVYERSELLLRMAQLIRENIEPIAAVLTLEQGKPFKSEAVPEVAETALNFQLAGEDVVRMEGILFPLKDSHKRMLCFREPIGVMATITPWNFPTVIPAEYIAPGLVVGNTMVMKPSPNTPLSMIMVAQLIQQALEEFGCPSGVFNLLTAPGADVPRAMTMHPDVGLIGFTGQSATGEAIEKQAGLKQTLMELGGNGPHIVCADANLKAAAKAAALGAYFNAGQVCCATERILVDKRVHDDFMGELLSATEEWRLGDPRLEDTNVGPLNNEPVAKKTTTHLEDALKKGARIITGGSIDGGRPTDLYFPPTIIDGVKRDMLLNREETFGPVAPVLTFEDSAEALEVASETGYGLQMSVFTSSMNTAFYFIDNLRTGNLVVNDTACWWETATPFGGGGSTRSGHGRLGGRFVLEDLTYMKTATIDFTNVAK